MERRFGYCIIVLHPLSFYCCIQSSYCRLYFFSLQKKKIIEALTRSPTMLAFKVSCYRTWREKRSWPNQANLCGNQAKLNGPRPSWATAGHTETGSVIEVHEILVLLKKKISRQLLRGFELGVHQKEEMRGWRLYSVRKTYFLYVIQPRYLQIEARQATDAGELTPLYLHVFSPLFPLIFFLFSSYTAHEMCKSHCLNIYYQYYQDLFFFVAYN